MIHEIDDLNELLGEVAECKKCAMLKPWVKFSANVHGNKQAYGMIVSEAPGEDSIKIGEFWRGNSGSRLRNVLSTTGKTLENLFYLTDTVKCCPPSNRQPDASEISNCRNFLDREIMTVRPKYVLVFGETAVRYFLEHYPSKPKIRFSSMLDLQNKKGFKVLECSHFKLIPLYHPSAANIPQKKGNLEMNYEIYKKQLREVYDLVIKESQSAVNL